MNLICKLFGHGLPTGYNLDPPYLQYTNFKPMDGIGRHHRELFTTCKRCGKQFIVGRIHLPKLYT